MAPKRSSLLENPPAASSSEEEVDSEEEEVEKVPAVKGGAGGNESDSDDSEDDEDGNESDSDDFVKSSKKPSNLNRTSTPTEKPSKQTHVAKPSQPKKTASKPTVSTPTKPSATTGKRPLETEKVMKEKEKEKEKDSKIKSKKKKIDDGHGKEGGEKMSFDDYVMSDHKNPFQRLWNEDDEIALLKVMADFVRKGIDPTSDLEDLLDTVKNSIHFDVNKEQLSNKTKRLKRKYQTNAKKGKGGEDPTFSKPHDTKCYQLMKEIWGGKDKKGVEEAVNGNGVKNKKGVDEVDNGKEGKSQKPKSTVGEVSAKPKGGLADEELEKLEEETLSIYPCLNDSIQFTKKSAQVSESLLKEGLSLLGESKVKELELKWRKMQTEEFTIHLKRLELEREQTMALLDAIKKSKS